MIYVMGEKSGGYGKRPLWQWIVLYVVIGAIVYALVYYFVFAKKGGYNYNQPGQTQTQTTPSTPQTAAKNVVEIKNFAFTPATLTVKVGDKVTWTNQDSASHTATADDNSFNTGVLTTGQSGSVTFSKAGTYTYHCTIHPGMKGTIVVEQ